MLCKYEMFAARDGALTDVFVIQQIHLYVCVVCNKTGLPFAVLQM